VPQGPEKPNKCCSFRQDLRGALDIVVGTGCRPSQIQWLNTLLIFVPLGLIAEPMGLSATGIFVLNFLAIVPLAAILGEATEELAKHVGDTLGGLLNATWATATHPSLPIATAGSSADGCLLHGAHGITSGVCPAAAGLATLSR
jgi:hypothetical protein